MTNQSLPRAPGIRFWVAQVPGEVLSAIMDNVAAGVICLDEAGQIQSFSRSAEKMFGYAADEVIGQNFSMLMLEEHDGCLSPPLTTDQGKIVAKESL